MYCIKCNKPLGAMNKSGECAICKRMNTSSFPHDYKCTLMYLKEHGYPKIVRRDGIIDYIYPDHSYKNGKRTRIVRRNVSQSLLREGYKAFNAVSSVYFFPEEA